MIAVCLQANAMAMAPPAMAPASYAPSYSMKHASAPPMATVTATAVHNGEPGPFRQGPFWKLSMRP